MHNLQIKFKYIIKKDQVDQENKLSQVAQGFSKPHQLCRALKLCNKPSSTYFIWNFMYTQAHEKLSH